MIYTLYRGDATNIDEFKFNKTNTYCLVGQGIYLTDKLSIANTYRTKGSGKDAKIEIFSGFASNRLEAYEKGFEHFTKELWCDKVGYFSAYPKNVKEKNKFLQEARSQFQILIESKRITADYTPLPYGVVKPSKETGKYIKVIWNKDPNFGFVTRFDFDQNYFNASMFHVDNVCRDESFWSMMYENKIEIGTSVETIEEYIKVNKSKSIIQAIDQRYTDFGRKQTEARYKTYNKISDILKPFGILGFEYSGGRRLGGGYKHRAFCVWDEDFVNRHKIETFK